MTFAFVHVIPTDLIFVDFFYRLSRGVNRFGKEAADIGRLGETNNRAAEVKTRLHEKIRGEQSGEKQRGLTSRRSSSFLSLTIEA